MAHAIGEPCGITEVTPINRQKFLAELSRLLTFMYEEDRLRALDLYNSIFEDVDDETEILHLLVSPTRQAVNLARAYDAKERKLQVRSQSRADDNAYSEDEPAFVQVIGQIRAQAEALGLSGPKVDDGQISLFEEPDVAETVFDSLDLDGVSEIAGEEDAAAMPEAISYYPDEDRAHVPPAPPAAADVPAEPAEELPAPVAEAPADEVDAFLADFSIQDAELPPEETPAEAPAEAAAPSPAIDAFPADEEIAAKEAATPQPAAVVMEQALAEEPATQEPAAAASETAPAGEPAAAVKKPRILLLILYILLAVPVTLLLIGIVLALALSFLSGAAGGLGLSFFGITTAFTGFNVFADILLVFGMGLMALALGLLLLWFFIWMLFHAIPSLIRGAFALGRKLCFKEVRA